MSENPLPFDVFVEKVIIKNKLVPEAKLLQAKQYKLQKPELSLLDILVKANLLTEKHSQIIKIKFDEYQSMYW